MSLLQMWELVLEDGLPTRLERERILDERLNDAASMEGSGDTTTV